MKLPNKVGSLYGSFIYEFRIIKCTQIKSMNEHWRSGIAKHFFIFSKSIIESSVKYSVPNANCFMTHIYNLESNQKLHEREGEKENFYWQL